MIRIIVRTNDAGMAVNVGGAVHTEFKTFDVHAPKVEELLRKHAPSEYCEISVIGVELIEEGR